ncbi:stalk domain-containing protein [Paenibacillus sp.]|uniref:stalk domain-containing protein n=1 Tax=Paenibacillus sp. TaxID=58172 RepID=UPI00281208A5|nr:stalk domain-containing protein [Paenibacillus sp.]
MKRGRNRKLAAAAVLAMALPAAGAFAAEDMTMKDMADMADMTEMPAMKDMGSVPLRKTAEMLGYVVHWDAAANTVTLTYQGMESSLKGKIVVLTLSNGIITVNGENRMEKYDVTVDEGVTHVAPRLIDDVLRPSM